MTAHVIEIVLYIGVGGLLIVLGLLIWKKQKLSILHDYHYKNVKEEDVPAYTGQIGIGLSLIGAGICLTGVLDLLRSSFWWLPMLAGFVLGIIVMHKAQKKYNGSWFS